MTATSGALRFSAFCAAALTLVALLVVVFERVGVPVAILAAGLVCLLLVGAIVGGAVGGVMRFPVFLTGGRAFPPLALALAMAASWAGTATPATLPAVAAGLLLAGLVVAPAIGRSGAPGIPSFLQQRFGSALLRALSAAVIAGTAFLLGAERLLALLDAMPALLGLSRGGAGWLIGAVLLAMLVPGGVRGLALSLLALGLAAVAAACVIGWWGIGALVPTAREILIPATNAGALAVQASALALALCAPHLAMLGAAGRNSGDLRRAALWATLLALAFGVATALGIGASALFPAMAAGILQIALDLACAAGLLLAAACAAAFEIPGKPDRRRNPTSRRFAWLRLAVIAMTGFAVWAATIHPGAVRGIAPAASAVLTAAILPPLVLALAIPRAAWPAGLAACAIGLAVSMALLDGRVLQHAPWAGDYAPWPGLAGAGAGFALGVLLALVLKRQAAERPPMEDEAL